MNPENRHPPLHAPTSGQPVKLRVVPSYSDKRAYINNLRSVFRTFAAKLNTPVIFLDELPAYISGLDAPLLPTLYRDIINQDRRIVGFCLQGQSARLEVELEFDVPVIRSGLYVVKTPKGSISSGENLAVFDEIKTQFPANIRTPVKSRGGYLWDLQNSILAFATIEAEEHPAETAGDITPYLVNFLIPDELRSDNVIDHAEPRYFVSGTLTAAFMSRLEKARREPPVSIRAFDLY